MLLLLLLLMDNNNIQDMLAEIWKNDSLDFGIWEMTFFFDFLCVRLSNDDVKLFFHLH